MQLEHIFLLLWFIIMLTILSIHLIKGNKKLDKFPKLNESEFEYIENYVSGYSTDSFKTLNTVARKILKIRITKSELWISTNRLMAYTVDIFGLLQIIPIKSIISVKIEKKKILLEYEKHGITKRLVLISNNKKRLVDILNYKIQDCSTKNKYSINKANAENRNGKR